jgi:hypothetical protein
MDLLVPLDKGGTPQHVIPAQAGIQKGFSVAMLLRNDNEKLQ